MLSGYLEESLIGPIFSRHVVVVVVKYLVYLSICPVRKAGPAFSSAGVNIWRNNGALPSPNYSASVLPWHLLAAVHSPQNVV